MSADGGKDGRGGREHEPGPVVVGSAPDAVSGAMLAAALESAGIPAEVRGGRQGWLYPGAHGGFGSVLIWVPAAAEADARAILAELEQAG